MTVGTIKSVLGVAAVCLVFPSAESVQADVAVWNRWEQTLTSSSTYTNPYQQVTLSVTYAGPSGQKIKGYGFWDGGNTPFLGASGQKVGWAKSTTVSDANFRWNPAFWQGVDRKVQYANDQGMIAFFCAIGQNHNGHNFPKTDRTQVELFARNFAARMMGNFVVFSPDADYYWTQSGDWSGLTAGRMRCWC